MEEKRNTHRVVVRKSERKERLEPPGLEGMIILK
jgi:hypothetical protein